MKVYMYLVVWILVNKLYDFFCNGFKISIRLFFFECFFNYIKVGFCSCYL